MKCSAENKQAANFISKNILLMHNALHATPQLPAHETNFLSLAFQKLPNYCSSFE